MVLKLENIGFGKIWDSKLPTLMSHSYKNLTHLTLYACDGIKYVFSFCIAKSFKALQRLEIKSCNSLKQIVAEEGAEHIVNFPFQQLTFLELAELPKLTAFCHGIDTWELPMLKGLVVKECEKFTSKYLSFHEISLHISEPKSLWLDNKINDNLEEFALIDYLTKIDDIKAIQWESKYKALKIKYDESANIPFGLLQRFKNLEELKLYSCNQYKELFFPNHEVLDVNMCSKLKSLTASSASFQNLKVLRVNECHGLMKLITPSTARSLEQLREMSIECCEMLIEIVENEGDATSTEIIFDNLKTLLLIKLENLLCFCSGNYFFNFPSLEWLYIEECPNMKIFSQGILSTLKLHQVDYAENIVVEIEGNDLNKTIQGEYKKKDIFFDLKFLKFQDDNSTEICYNQRPNSFYQNLTHLILWNCANIKYVFPSSIAKSFYHLQQLKIQNCKVLEEIVSKEEGENAVVNFVFPYVTLLKLIDLPELTAFYPEIHTSKWPMLKELTVANCNKFTSKHMSFQKDIEEGGLHISKPKSLFLDDKINQDLEVFELRNGKKEIIWQSQSRALKIKHDDRTNIPLGLLHQNLEVLEVPLCSKLMSLRPFSTSFQNLKVLSVDNCNGLMKLITPSIARNLVQLIEMSVDSCRMLTEIVENEGEGDATTSTEIVFNNLKKLSLKSLENLICFCSKNYSFNFPFLEELNIVGCPNIKIFSQGILCTPKLHKVNKTKYERDKRTMEVENDLNTTMQQEHKRQADSNLKELTLSGRDIESIWKGEFQESFDKVETLQLIKDVYANIPIQVLHKFNSLENLILKVSSYKEIFSCEEDDKHIEALTKLKHLKLQYLYNLKCIWKQDPWSNSILQNLSSLKVHYCHNLITLLPSLASFENLRTLSVSNCNGMKNLMSSSTIKNLVQLEDLSISGCEMMIEVLANDGDIEECEIVFEKLESLCLINLGSLTCFWYGDYTLRFPNLESLYVNGCSKMKTLSGGGLSMPRLKELNYKSCSESDIDIIIQQLQNDCSNFCERF